MSETFPRTLLLTAWAPDTRYKVIRRIVDLLPEDRICWCSLAECRSGDPLPFRHRAFEPRRLHWRLQNTTPDLLYSQQVQGPGLARRMAEWVREFQPQVLWVLSEWGAATVGYHVHRLLGLPLHVTVHDAYETARFLAPAAYFPFYIRSLGRLSRCATTTDAVSLELVDHLRRRYGAPPEENTFAFPPSVPRDVMAPPLSRPPFAAQEGRRRIGFCGALRARPWQWQAFLDLLGRLPHAIEIVAFANRDYLPRVRAPRNVTVLERPFAPTEAEVVRAFREEGVDACYLPLYRDGNRRLFGRTSLSAKLITYAAAALPVIVDSERDSVAWRLVRTYRAGMRRGEGGEETLAQLRELLEREETWQRCSEGAARMCRQEFDLGVNVERLTSLLRLSAERESGPQRRGR